MEYGFCLGLILWVDLYLGRFRGFDFSGTYSGCLILTALYLAEYGFYSVQVL